MRFRNLRAEELEGSAEIEGLEDWLRTTGATDASVLILAPAGTGKAAAVGRLAHRLGRDVLLCNLMELFDHAEPERQLDGLLRLCASQRHSVIYLDKLDKALGQAEKSGSDSAFVDRLAGWLSESRSRLLDDECTVVFTGREPDGVPEPLRSRFDKCLIAA